MPPIKVRDAIRIVTAYYVIPSVAEESEMPVIDSISGFLDSSATLGMT